MKQISLFDKDKKWKAEQWEEEWEGMPEYIQADLTSYTAIKIHFANLNDMKEFSELIGQPITKNTQSIWYPKAEIGRIANKRYLTEKYNES